MKKDNRVFGGEIIDRWYVYSTVVPNEIDRAEALTVDEHGELHLCITIYVGVSQYFVQLISK